MARLPIEDVLEDIRKTLSANSSAVLVAPPGAGKTTCVPLMLLNEPWLNGREILMLEPRRLAARAAARYMALLLGEKVGETVGYRVRLDSKVGPKTRIEVVTEGVLIRMLQGDPALESVGAVIFDEFHERNLQADLGLAFCLESQAVLRPDLRLLVMSATLETGKIASLMNDAPVIEELMLMVTFPSIIGMLVHDLTKGRISHFAQSFGGTTSKIGIFVVITINAAVVMPQISWNASMIKPLIVTLFIVSAGYFVGYLGSFALKDRTKELTLTMMFNVGIRNNACGLVIALTYFPPAVAIPMTLSILYQQPLATVITRAFKQLRPAEEC